MTIALTALPSRSPTDLTSVVPFLQREGIPGSDLRSV